MSKFKGFTLAVGVVSALVVLLPTLAIAQSKADWRYFRSYERRGRVPSSDEFIDISSVKKKADVWEFQTLSKAADGANTYTQIRINCRQNYLDNVSSRVVKNGRTTDTTSVSNIFDGVADYMVQPYCRLLSTGNLQSMPTTWVPGQTLGGRSTSGRCNSPDDLDARGRRCGGRASSVRPGGRP